jgi:hypothetical protein
MLLFHSATKLASDEKIITNFAASTRQPAVSLDESSDADGNDNRPACAARVAADYADFKPPCSPAQTTIKLSHPPELRLIRGDQGNQRELGHGGGRGKIAERAHHCFPTNIDRIGPRQKVHALDNAISFEREKGAACKNFYHSAVIARACDDGFSQRQMRQELAEQSVFAELAQFHCGMSSGKASTMRVTELKSECIVIATRMEPLHS